MKVQAIAASLALVASVACAGKSNIAGSYPEGSLARRAAELYDKSWGRLAFGGEVGQQAWPTGAPKSNNADDDEDDDEDTTTTITSTVMVTVTKTRTHTATPVAKVKRTIARRAEGALDAKEEAALLNDVFSLGLFQPGQHCNPEYQSEVCSGNSVIVCDEASGMWEVKNNCTSESLKCGAIAAQDGSNNILVQCLAE